MLLLFMFQTITYGHGQMVTIKCWVGHQQRPTIMMSVNSLNSFLEVIEDEM